MYKRQEETITSNVFERVASFALIDKYQAYQLLNDQWGGISSDLEIIQTEGFAAAKQVDPNMVIKLSLIHIWGRDLFRWKAYYANS